jgi:hypothetical protein
VAPRQITDDLGMLAMLIFLTSNAVLARCLTPLDLTGRDPSNKIVECGEPRKSVSMLWFTMTSSVGRNYRRTPCYPLLKTVSFYNQLVSKRKKDSLPNLAGFWVSPRQ